MTAALDLDSYRSEAEAFCEALDREYYVHLAGHKRELEVEPIYDRHRELFSRRAVEQLRELADSSRGEAGRRTAYLLEFAVHGHLGLATSSYEARLAELEVGLDVEVGGQPIPFRVAPVELANEADAARRAAISDARDALVTEHLDPVYLEALERTHELARALGWSSYRDMCVQLRGVDLDALAAQTRAFLDATAALYPDVLDSELEASGLPVLGQLRRSDLPRFFRAPELDAAFSRRSPDLVSRGQPRGPRDWARGAGQRPSRHRVATYQEPAGVLRARSGAGRDLPRDLTGRGARRLRGTVSRGRPRRALRPHRRRARVPVPPPRRRLGHGVVRLPDRGDDIASGLARVAPRRRGADRSPHAGRAADIPAPLRRQARVQLAHAEGARLDAMAARYSQLLGDATAVPWPRANWLADVDPAFYVACYLRAWALEAIWRRALTERFGESWFAEPAGGEWLRGLWRNGQRLRADELLAETLGEEDFTALAAEFAAPTSSWP